MEWERGCAVCRGASQATGAYPILDVIIRQLALSGLRFVGASMATADSALADAMRRGLFLGNLRASENPSSTRLPTSWS